MQSVIFSLLLIFLPTQLGLHFWPSWAIVNGLRLDYFSPTIYLTDVLVIAFIILNFKFQILKEFFKSKITISLFIVLLGFITLNTCSSISPYVTLYKWLKVLEFGFLIYFISKRSTSLLSNYPTILLISIFYVSLLTIWQFLSQSSINGLWYYLGERTFNSLTPGIANAFINGQLIMRPYATFSHPNVLGGFLAIVLPLLIIKFPHNSRRYTVPILILGYIALFLSLSRVAILVGLVSTLFIVRKKYLILFALFVLFALFPRYLSLNTETEPITVRQQLNTLAIQNWQHSPIIGTGLGTSPLYSQKLHYQPTHNIYLMLLSETGLIGLAIFSILIIKLFNPDRIGIKFKIPLISILILGAVDHYWLTQQQTQLLLALIIGIILS